MQTGQPPSLGRIVHFTCDTERASKLNQLGLTRKYTVGEKVAGIVTRALENNTCNLTIFPDGDDVMYLAHIPFSAGNQPGTWNWPERVGVTEAQAVA